MRIAVAFILLGALALPSRAQDTAPEVDAKTVAAKEHFANGKQQYDLGYFPEALAEFEKAYAAKPLPALLFNIGQCHFQERRYDRAVFFYERYLELVPEAPNRALVEGLISEAKAAREKAAAEAKVESVVPAPAPVVVAPPPTVPEPPPPDNTLWVVAGVGAAVVALAGGTVAVIALSQQTPTGTLGVIDRRAQ